MHAKPFILALCSSLLLSTGVGARQPGDQLTVVASPEKEITYRNWSNRTENRLANSVRRNAGHFDNHSSVGFARVQFRLDGNGRPQAVALAQPSESRTIDRISLRAVKTMGSLTPLPQGISADSKFEAWIIVANDVWQRDDMMNQLRAAHRTRTLAEADGERPVLIASR
ncbi:energy transducer TonB [Sphingobium sp. JS3065]|jgi:TonB family protein|uniref:energy transducer TonB family protein n=1 Tax=Sphingobium sp. JS3065 TaxID=2970925 RepID=UPI002264F288|nr:energy transducer TonB [Sphingobium sp. JS3065]UZW57284.1 energy transducer TonB [Sphingobium sp. JS3065]